MIELTPDVRREFERLHKRLDEIEENFGHDWNAMADLIHALYCPDCEGNANHERTLCQCSCHEDDWMTDGSKVLVSPREVHERAMELWVNEGAPGDELPEGRHYRRALAELEGKALAG